MPGSSSRSSRRIRLRRSLSAISFASLIVLATATGSILPSSSSAISIARLSSVSGFSSIAKPGVVLVVLLVFVIDPIHHFGGAQKQGTCSGVLGQNEGSRQEVLAARGG